MTSSGLIPLEPVLEILSELSGFRRRLNFDNPDQGPFAAEYWFEFAGAPRKLITVTCVEPGLICPAAATGMLRPHIRHMNWSQLEKLAELGEELGWRVGLGDHLDQLADGVISRQAELQDVAVDEWEAGILRDGNINTARHLMSPALRPLLGAKQQSSLVLLLAA